MQATKKARFAALFGDDLAAEVEDAAREATKALEMRVAFKTLKVPRSGEQYEQSPARRYADDLMHRRAAKTITVPPSPVSGYVRDLLGGKVVRS